MSNSYDKVVNVISKKPDLRQEFEIQALLPWLRKKSQLFAKLKTDRLKDIVRNCGLVNFKKDDIIIRQGDRGDCFYIILGGKISIFIINKDKEEEGDETNALAQIGTLTKDGELDRSRLGNFVCSLGSGVPFGEVALISEDCIRTATIIAEEKTDLLMVERALYNRAVRDVLAQEFEEKQNFVKNHQLFSNWAPKYRKQLTMALYKESFPYDTHLVRQGETVTNIYYLIGGQVEIRTDPTQHPSQYPKLFKLLEDERAKLIQEKKLRPPTEAQSTSVNLKKKDSSKTTKLCFLGINESIGEAEVLLDMNTYIYTAVCTEKTDVMVLEMKHYERLFVKRHPRTIESMRNNLGVKLEARKSVMTSKEKREIPLFGLLQQALHLMNNPAPSVDKRKKQISVQSARKQFINHKGPLLDIHGPGSVFYMIRKREESRLKFKAYQKRRGNSKLKQQTSGHMHSITLPHSLLMAAEMSGATRTNDVTIDTEPGDQDKQNISNNAKTNKSSVRRTRTKSSKQTKDSAPSVTRIHSAKQTKDSAPSVTRIHSAKQTKDSAPSVTRIHSATHTRLDVTEENSGEEDAVSKATLFPSYLITNNGSGYDSDGNEAALSELEQKVSSWLRQNNPKGSNKITKLRRLALAELETRPKPGNKIVIRRRYKFIKSESMLENRPAEKTAVSEQNFANTARNNLERYRILLSLTK